MKRTPLYWLRILGRVLIGRHEDPVEKKEDVTDEEVRVFLGSHGLHSPRKEASLQIHTTTRVKVGQTKVGTKLHIFRPGSDHKAFYCGVGGAARSTVVVVNTLNSEICKNCLRRKEAS